MADHTAIAAVSRTLRRLLQDRMATEVAVTVAPPDQTVAGFDGARVNLYPVQVLENIGLKNEGGPPRGHPSAYGRPPLALNLRYMLTSHAETETQPESDITAQEILGDAMRVLHYFGNRLDGLTLVRLAPPEDGEPVLDPALQTEHERLKVVLHPALLEDVTKIWSAFSEENLRRTVVYEVTVVQIEDTVATPVAAPVEERRILVSLARAPVIERVFVTPGPGEPEGEGRVRIGEEITILARHAARERVFVQLGRLAPMRVAPAPDGRITLTVPDADLPVDFDPPVTEPIPEPERLRPGTLEIRLIAEVTVEGVAGALERGTRIEETRRVRSNTALLQLVPQIAGVAPASGAAGTILQVTGTRLWHPRAAAQVQIGPGAVTVRAPETPGDWAAPTPTAVEVPVDEAGLEPGTHDVSVIVDGARSRDAFSFTLTP